MLTRPVSRRRGFSLIELLIVVAIIMIIAAIALPKINQARMQAQETAAVQQIRTINAAQTQFLSQFGRFAANLTELGPPSSGQPNASAADLIPKNLAEGNASGFLYEVKGTQATYSINANPINFGNTGRHTYYSDQTLVIRVNDSSEPATPTSREIR